MNNKIIYDYSKLRGRVIEKFKKIKNYAPALGISKTSLSNKLNNKVPFNQEEITRSVELLDIPYNEINLYFFAEIVKKL